MKNLIQNPIFITFFVIFFGVKSSKIISEYFDRGLNFPADGESFAYSLGVEFADLLIIFVAISYLKLFIERALLRRKSIS